MSPDLHPLRIENRLRPVNRLGVRATARRDMGFFTNKEYYGKEMLTRIAMPRDCFYEQDGCTGNFELQLSKDLVYLENVNDYCYRDLSSTNIIDECPPSILL